MFKKRRVLVGVDASTTLPNFYQSVSNFCATAGAVVTHRRSAAELENQIQIYGGIL